jgi:poly(3-hydroxybutyrate) depolymerase
MFKSLEGNYNIDTSKITVSGISSGAAMASQLAVTYSSTFSGHGSVAGRKIFKIYQ